MAAPTLTKISPIYGYYKGGDVLTLTGTGFQTGVTSLVVSVGGIACSNVVVASDTSLTAVVPALAAPAEFPVLVVTNLGTSNAVSFYATSTTVPSGKFSSVDPFLDPDADYVVFGQWQFAKTPITPQDTPAPSGAWGIAGNALGAPGIFGTLDNQPVSLQANSVEYMNFDPGTLVLNATANNFNVSAASTAVISAVNGVTIDSALSVDVGALAAQSIIIGNSDPACQTIVVSPVVQMPNIPKNSSTSLLFFNEADGTITFDTVNDNLQYWKINANNTESSLQFGTPNVAGWTYIVNGVSVGSVGSSGKLQWNADFGVSADKTVNMFVGNPTSPGPVSAHSLVVKAVGIFSGQGEAGSQLIAIGGDASVTSVVGQASLSGATISITGTGGNTGPSGSNVYLHSTAGIVRIESETDVVTILAGDRVFANSANETKLVSQALVTLGSQAPGCVLSLDVTASTMTFNATNGYTIVNVPAQTPTAGAPTNVPPVNWQYLIVDTTTGAIGRFPSN